MELCTLTSHARENVIQTYIGLAQQIEGTRLLSSPSFSGVISLRPYSFCNFVIGLAGDPSTTIGDILMWSRAQPAMRVFTMTGDQSDGWASALTGTGFAPLHHLVQMSCEVRPTLHESRWIKCESPDRRVHIAQFMVQQFFAMNEAGFRRAVIQATAQGPHELWCLERSGKVVAAAMIVHSRGAIGLYNVCVAPEFRRRGYGEELIRCAQQLASSSDMPLVLQCEENLVRWYGQFGFQVFGEMQSFQYRFH